jgi:hypothetical protein
MDAQLTRKEWLDRASGLRYPLDVNDPQTRELLADDCIPMTRALLDYIADLEQELVKTLEMHNELARVNRQIMGDES